MRGEARTGRAAVLVLGAFASGLALLAYYGAPRARIRPQTPPRRPVVAVLPFDNLGAEPGLEVLAAEITAKISDALSRRSELELVPRERSLDFQGMPGGVEAVSGRLGADYVISGSLDAVGDRLQADVYLYRAGPEPALWADRIAWSAAESEGLPAELARRVDAAVVDRE